ncbi:MAG: ATP-binding cassette domain-containing protein [Eubacteriales bacterium]
MALLELKGVGKIYVSEGAVSVGIRGVNLSFDTGEFVAVTGKSGSGKTTLLNLMSGIDSYEEGELLIEGTPTSHYTQADWEEYREKYISFIFQDYNIIDSFTVLENVELSLLHIASAKERRERALELLRRVGMEEFKHHRGSKLSGGQKQRTVIARALAKDSPIILADEPTGNLDSRSAREIVELLREVSKDKLVVVVTHNFAELEGVATREIRVFDGQIERDEVLSGTTPAPVRHTKREGERRGKNFRWGMLLGWHRFRATPRLTAFICLVMVLALLGTFAMTSKLLVGSGTDEEMAAETPLFQYIDGRLILARHDNTGMSEQEVSLLARIVGAQTYLYDDSLLASQYYAHEKIPDEDKYLSVTYTVGYDPDGIPVEPDIGRLPETSDEVLLYFPIAWKQIYNRETVGTATFKFFDTYNVKVSGIKFYYDNTKDAKVYLTGEGFERWTLGSAVAKQMHSCEIVVGDGTGSGKDLELQYSSVVPDATLAAGTIAFASTSASVTGALAPLDGKLLFGFGGISYLQTEEFSVKIDPVRSRDLATVTIGENTYSDYYDRYERLYVSEDIYAAMYTALIQDGRTASSLFFTNDRRAEDARSTLANLDFDALRATYAETDLALLDDGYLAVLSDAYSTSAENLIFGFVMNAIFYLLWFLAVLFLSFFLYLCFSRAMHTFRGDIGILRSMGLTTAIIRTATYAQSFYSMIPAVAIAGGVIFALYRNPATNPMFPFLSVGHYFWILFGAVLLCTLVARRYNRKVFSESVRKTLKGGADHA